MKLKKREIGTRTWKDYETPKEWDVKTIADAETPMEAKINCANCGRMTPYGESYKTTTIINGAGIAMAVCPDCHEVEMRKRADAGEL